MSASAITWLKAVAATVGITAVALLLVLVAQALLVHTIAESIIGGLLHRPPPERHVGPIIVALTVVAAVGQLVATALLVPRIGPPEVALSTKAALLLAVLIGPLPYGLFSYTTMASRRAAAEEATARARAEQDRR